MDSFEYRQGELFCEDVPAGQIAEAAGTPTFVYSAATLIEHYDRIAAAFAVLRPIICYSIKSCQNIHLIRLLAERGAGMDVVSGGELFRALKGGADPARIVYAGVGKTDREIHEAIDAGIGWFNIESEAELANIIALATDRNVVVRAALRVNPDVDPKTHRHTSTGKKETKFGVDIERARRVFDEFGRNPRVRLTGLHLHIGSPVNTVAPYVEAIRKALALIGDLRAAGFTIDTLDIGGGFGADYETDQAPFAAEYAQHIVPLLKDQGLHVILEPGRSISANAGVLLARVLYVKQAGDKQFVIVDAAMTDLIRPALYDASHFLWPVRPGTDHVPARRRHDLRMPGCRMVDVVGPVCESGDFLARERYLPPVQRGDLLAVFTAGAYGFVMASHYNSRPNAAEVLVEGNAYRIIRRRENYPDLIEPEKS
ncbi:MAG: diaminopimelate decarboxylase [Phycisphaerales bacterium]|nr:diaminopimelate decarboxylase [Phycisphaerales bacterium]